MLTQVSEKKDAYRQVAACSRLAHINFFFTLRPDLALVYRS